MTAINLKQAKILYPEASEDCLCETVAPFLSRYEVLCRCGCGEWQITQTGLYLWTAIRYAVGFPIYVTSGRRCKRHNATVGSGLMHPRGEAFDLAYPKYVSTTTFLAICEGIVRLGGLGVYNWGVHVDTGVDRDPHRRWKEQIDEESIVGNTVWTPGWLCRVQPEIGPRTLNPDGPPDCGGGFVAG